MQVVGTAFVRYLGTKYYLGTLVPVPWYRGTSTGSQLPVLRGPGTLVLPGTVPVPRATSLDLLSTLPGIQCLAYRTGIQYVRLRRGWSS